MEMNTDVAQQVLDELIPIFETLETQSAAILRFLREKGIATEQDLAPYLEQAGDASSVKWRAARLRLGRLLSLTEKAANPASDERKRLEDASDESGTTTPVKHEQRETQDEQQAESEQGELHGGAAEREGDKSVEDRRRAQAAERQEQAEIPKSRQQQAAQLATQRTVEKTFGTSRPAEEDESADLQQNKSKVSEEKQAAREKPVSKEATQPPKLAASGSQQKADAPAETVQDRGRAGSAGNNHQKTVSSQPTKPRKKNAA